MASAPTSMPGDLMTRVKRFMSKVDRDRFAGNAIRGSLPVLPARDALPAAGEDYHGVILRVTGPPDAAYWCAEIATGSYAWVPLGRAGTGTELTIASGAVTASSGYHTVDTESNAATDDLDTINGGYAGMTLLIRAADGARTVVAKDGTGNLKLSGDCTLDNAEDTLLLIYDGSNWLEVSRSDNGA